MLRLLNFLTKPSAAAATILLLGAAIGAGSAQAAVLDFVENFDSGTAPDFTFFSVVPAADVWTVGNGVLAVDTVRAQGVLYSAGVQITDDLSSTDIVLSTTLNATMLDGNSDVGFAAFGDNETFNFGVGVGHYLADFKANGNFRLLKVATGGAITDLVPGGGFFTFDTSETYTLTLEARYSGTDLDIKFTIDDPSEPLPISIMATDSSPLTGQYFGPRIRTGGVGGVVAPGAGEQIIAVYDDFSVSVAVDIPIADFDDDGDVDGADFLKWQRGESPNALSASDLLLWEDSFGTPAPAMAAVGTVPEPTTFLLLLGGLTFAVLLPRGGMLRG